MRIEMRNYSEFVLMYNIIPFELVMSISNMFQITIQKSIFFCSAVTNEIHLQASLYYNK